MKINKKIGIIGNGFVGSAVEFGFSANVGVDADVKVDVQWWSWKQTIITN